MKGDSRSPKYRAKYGNLGAEVEALDSQELRDRVEDWIQSHLDLEALDACRALEETERVALASLKL